MQIIKNMKKSVFQQMYEGTRNGEGSFNQNLYSLYISGSGCNRLILNKAFSHFFNSGDERLEWKKYDEEIGYSPGSLTGID